MNRRQLFHVLAAVSLFLAFALGTLVAPSAADGPGPVIAVFIEQNHVVGFHWPVGTALTLTIDDPATPNSIDYQETQIVEADPDPFTPGSTAAKFWPGEAFTIRPGHVVTLSDGGQTLAHTVTSLTVDGADMVGDRLWGTAAPGSVVEARHFSQRDIVRYETANAAGNWTADFSVPGDEPSEALIHNFNEDTRFMIMQSNGGGHTQIDWGMPHPGFVVQLTQNEVSTSNWPLGYAVALEIDDPGNGPGTDYSITTSPAPCDWNSEVGCFGIALGDAFRVRAGHLVTLTNGFITQIHAVSAIQMTDIDSDTDTVSGTAEQGAKVHVQMQYLQGTIQRHVIADESGNWTADFSVPGAGNDEQLTLDLIPWHEGTVRVSGRYGSTEVTWPVELEINVGDEINALNWYYGDEVTLTIDDPATPAAPDYTGSGFPQVGPWAYTGLEFDIGATFRTQSGHSVELTQNGRGKICVVAPIAITGVDFVADKVTGVSNPNAQVNVSVPVGRGDEWARYRYTEADASGHWQVDFSQPGTHIIRHPDEIEIVDIVPEMSIGAAEGAEDACFTIVWIRARLPVIRVRLTAGEIYAQNYLPGSAVTLSVFQPGNLDPVYTDSKLMGANNLIVFEYPDTLDIGAGYLVRTSDGIVIKEHIVTAVWIDSVDRGLDKAYGAAAAGTPVTVVARSTSVRAQRDLISGPDGTWMADFAVPGAEPWEQDVIDLDTAYIVFAYQVDDDSDMTWVHSMFNQPPLALDDGYATDEDVSLTVNAPGVLANDSDADGDSLTARLLTDVSHGTLALGSNGAFTYTPDPNWNGDDSFTYVANDGTSDSNVATVTIQVAAVNDAPAASTSLVSQTVQYSDGIVPVSITATDGDSTQLSISASALPVGLALSEGSCSPFGAGVACTWVLDGQALAAAGVYPIAFTVSDGELSTPASTTLVVKPEDAKISFAGSNPVSVRVATSGGNSGSFQLTIYVNEAAPDAGFDPHPGDINLAQVSMSLAPVGPGSSASPGPCARTVSGTGYAAILAVTCEFNNVAVNTYAIEITAQGGYYAGHGEDVLAIYDPGLGFATGGGWFYWPGTTEKTNFGFTMKYNRKGERVQGSLLLIRHATDGSIYRVKSNALDGLALGRSTNPLYGWVSFSGKATYLEPGWLEPLGNYRFVVYAEDRDEPGAGVDRFWIEVSDSAGKVVARLSMNRDAPGHAVSLRGGNIAIPH